MQYIYIEGLPPLYISYVSPEQKILGSDKHAKVANICQTSNILGKMQSYKVTVTFSIAKIKNY